MTTKQQECATLNVVKCFVSVHVCVSMGGGGRDLPPFLHKFDFEEVDVCV